jgi:TonB family protein
VFPADMSFTPADPDQDFMLQEAAREIISELRAGRFDHWIERKTEGWQYVIDGYRGPVRSDRLLVPRLLPTDVEFAKFTAPAYPPLARQARIQGNVRLSLDFGPDGSVIEARAIEGHPLLAPAALEAASSWRADTASVDFKQAEIEIAFELKCED